MKFLFAALLCAASLAHAQLVLPTTPQPTLAPAPMPAALDHSLSGPTIDRSLIPPPATGHADRRVRSVLRSLSSGADCSVLSVDCVMPAVFRIASSDIGAFRVNCTYAKMAFDDPIVFPAQAGVSHLHTFTGNTGVDAYSTAESIAGTGNSTCAGGILDRSSYWFPAMIDTADGRPIAPTANLVYYKGSYQFDISKTVQAPPAGLRMVSGNAKNTDPETTGARYICLGPHRENPGWKRTIAQANADGTCVVGGDFIMRIDFPNCWDGVNLDSPNHAAHVVEPEHYWAPPRPASEGGAYQLARCPADHPVPLPVISYNIHYKITDNGAVGRWRLSSDSDPSLPAGISGHADYFGGWDTQTMQAWVDGCVRAKRDCHADLLGNGTVLY